MKTISWMTIASLLAWALATAGCGGCPAGGEWCSSHADCDAGHYCNSQTGLCAQDCVSETDCPAGHGCSEYGQCVEAGDTDSAGPDTDPCGDPVLLVIDRSRSMSHDDRWTNLVDAVSEVVTAFHNDVDFGLLVFPDDSCDKGYNGTDLGRLCRGPDNATVDIGPGAGPSIRDSLESLGTCGGTPMSMALEKAAQLLGFVGGDAQLVLITDGLPNCNLAADVDDCECMLEPPLNCQTAPEHCLDLDRARERAAEIVGMGTPVHVLAFEMPADDATLLNRLAEAGGTEIAVPCVGAEALSAALTAILSTIIDC